MLLMKGENSEILVFLFRMYVQEYVGFSFGSGWVNVISVPPVGSRNPALWAVVRWSLDSAPYGH